MKILTGPRHIHNQVKTKDYNSATSSCFLIRREIVQNGLSYEENFVIKYAKSMFKAGKNTLPIAFSIITGVIVRERKKTRGNKITLPQ